MLEQANERALTLNEILQNTNEGVERRSKSLREDKEGSGMLIEAARYPSFILRERPNAAPGAPQTSRPASHISGSDLGGPRPRPAQRESEDWGDESGGRAFNLPPHPCFNVSESAREMRRDLLTRSGDALHVPSGGDVRRFMRPLRSVARKWQGDVHRLSVRVA